MNRLITSLLVLLSIAGAKAQQSMEIPKLVVSITVDQLREDYLRYFSPTFGEKGFKRLLAEGLVYHRMEYDFPNLCQSSAVATLFTGTNPFNHGIVADRKYDFETKREVSIVYDSNFLGNFTSDNLSPAALLSSTIGDELKIASGGRSDVFSIAPDATAAIVSAGRYANAAFWLENYKGKFATTTYYKEIPWYVDKYNATDVIGNTSESVWTPALSTYNAFPYTKNSQPFKHIFSKGDKDRYLKLKQSPLVNAEITNLAARFLSYADFGKRSYPDFLALTYYAGSYKNDSNDDYSIEIQDTYYRLDKELERLFSLLDQHIGLKNTLIVFTSTGYFESNADFPEGFKPCGEFFPNRCISLLNMYLMAIYGQGNWVDGYYNQQVYLNKKLIDNQKIDWNSILQKSAHFIAQFSGVEETTTSEDILFEVQSGGRSAVRRGMNKKISGDIFVSLQPGWVVVDEAQGQIGKSKHTENIELTSPLIFFGNNISKQEVYRPVRATAIAPSIAHVLRIRPPNSGKEPPLQELFGTGGTSETKN